MDTLKVTYTKTTITRSCGRKDTITRFFIWENGKMIGETTEIKNAKFFVEKRGYKWEEVFKEKI